jgi:hypothetical protein
MIMDKGQIENLISKFNAEQLTAAEQLQLEQLIESGDVDLDSLVRIQGLQEKIQDIGYPEPSSELDDRFYQMLALQKSKVRPAFSWSLFFEWPQLAPKLAFASITLLLGVLIGYVVKPAPASSGDFAALTQQVSKLQETMMLSLLEKESATERLKAVSLTSEMTGVSDKVTSALIQTLNNDENVNVRLAALEALVPYAREGAVREQLIRSIGKQNSPLVQVALAELMEKIQAKSSVEELQKIIQSERTPAEVKNKIKESIKILS